MALVKMLFEWCMKIPWYIQAVFALVIIPNFIINLIIFLIWFIPWNTQQIHAYITPGREIRAIELTSILKHQATIDQTISDSIKRIEKNQGIMYQALIDRQQNRD